MASLTLPQTLAPFCDGERRVDAEGATVRSALEAAFERHPMLRSQLVDEAGAMRPHLHLFLNEEDVRNALDTPLRPGDRLLVLRATSGG